MYYVTVNFGDRSEEFSHIKMMTLQANNVNGPARLFLLSDTGETHIYNWDYIHGYDYKEIKGE